MDQWMQMIVALVSGGGLVGIITAIFEYRKSKRTIAHQDVDERISFWENVAKQNDERMKQLELKQEAYDGAIRTLEAHISILEHLIIRNDPDIELPPRPPINLSVNRN